MANVNTLSKITVRKVFGAIPTVPTEVKEADGTKRTVMTLPKEMPLMRVYGQASGFRVATSQYGDSCVFKGIFKAINADTGEMFSAGECCLPKMLESQLSGILGDSDGAEFAFDIYATPAKNAFGYEYKIKTLIETVEAPIITTLEQKMGMLALPKSADSEAATSTPTAKSGRK